MPASSDVRWIDQVAETPSWTCHRADAWLLEGSGADARETRLGSFAEVATSIADNSRPADVTAELVDVGSGDRAADYEGKDVRGRIVLAYGSPSAVMEQAVWKRGAAGILAWSSTRLNPLADAADQIAWQGVPAEDGPNGEKTTFAFILSARSGKALADRLRGEVSTRWGGGGPGAASALRVRIVVESSVLPEKKTAMVEARIPGTDPSLPEIVLTSHLQEEKFSANDNQSGVASMLEIGRALTTLIAQGKLARPRRGIRFWWCDEIYSEYRYFATTRARKRRSSRTSTRTWSARSSRSARASSSWRARRGRGLRTSRTSRRACSTPSSRADNAYLPAWQADSLPPGVPFSKPIFSHLGTREPFHAQAVPYFDSTDHLAFNDVWVGVPGTTLTNWPDENIHSSGDDLWQIDATQLKRNAYVVAATAWWIANATADDVPFLASFVGARAAERLGRNLATAQTWIETGSGAADERRAAAANLLDAALAMELQTLETTRAVGPVSGTGPAALSDAASTLRSVAASLKARVAPAAAVSDPALDRLSGRTPRYAVATLDAWMTLEHRIAEKRQAEHRAQRDQKDADAAQRKAGKTPKKTAAPAEDDASGLSPLMETEAMSWIDGKTSAAEIARRVCAEALSAGHWYYGPATPAMVEKFLERQVRDGLIAW